MPKAKRGMMFSHRLQKTIHVNLNVFGAATNIAIVFDRAMPGLEREHRRPHQPEIMLKKRGRKPVFNALIANRVFRMDKQGK